MSGEVLGPRLVALARELARLYVDGNLVIVAGAGVSRAAGLPGWDQMIASLQASTAAELGNRLSPDALEAVLESLHRDDPISRADSLRRVLTTPRFMKYLYKALYQETSSDDPFRPSVSHWHIASLISRRLMANAFTSNYDDLLEDAKKALGRSGRVRHFHGRLPQAWSGSTLRYDPPVVTSRDYMAAGASNRYERFREALRDKTVLLVGLGLSDPNLARIIRSEARDCRAILVASPGGLGEGEQSWRLDLLRRFWHGLNVEVTAIEAYEELPGFLLALRREVAQLEGRSLITVGADALRASLVHSPLTWQGAREWRARLRDAVIAAKDVAPAVRRDRRLQAGFYGIEATGTLAHLVSSASTRRSHEAWPKRRLAVDTLRPWGAAGYAFAAGVPIASSSAGAAFDRNVPEADRLRWQAERAAQGRLPAAAVLCVPAWVRYDRMLVPIGVLYFSSSRGSAFDDPRDDDELRALLRYTLEGMLRPERVVVAGGAA